MNQENDIFQNILDTMNCILKWSRLIGFEKLRKIYTENFKENYELLLYDLSDGDKSSRDLAEILPISYKTVTNYWDKWVVLGIMEKVSAKGGGTRGKKIFSLAELGIKIPKL